MLASPFARLRCHRGRNKLRDVGDQLRAPRANFVAILISRSSTAISRGPCCNMVVFLASGNS